MIVKDEFRDFLPELTHEELALLEAECLSDGIRDPLVVWNDILIDGHNRYAIAKKHNLEYTTVQKDFESELHAKLFMIRLQKGKRNLSDAWKYKYSMTEREILEEIGRKKHSESIALQPKNDSGKFIPSLSIVDNDVEKHDTRKIIAESLGWSTGKVAMADRVFKSDNPEIQASVLSGEKSINEAYKEIKKNEMETRRDEMRENLSIQYLEKGEKKYRVVYADPPWKYGNTMPEYFTEQADHYTLMELQDICAMPVKEITEDNAVLFLWVTSPILEESFEVIKAWGFNYKTSFVWDKIKHNMGHYNSVRHELLLVCTKGSCTPDVKKLYDSVLSEERTQHSKKPETFRNIIDTIYPLGHRIELFARNITNEGWDVYGNQS
jgi:N6-adenosine-specific RNA methylase IME4